MTTKNQINMYEYTHLGSKCEIFASLRTRINIFSELKHIMMVTEIPRKGVIRCFEIAPNEL